MKKAEASFYLDRLRPKEDGTCSLKVKVTHNRKRKYISTGLDYSEQEFEKVFFRQEGQRLTKAQKKKKKTADEFLSKAKAVIDKLKIFTFTSFEEVYFENRKIEGSVLSAFEDYIKGLRKENRIGTAVTYECAKGSLEKFNSNKDFEFAEVTPRFLERYEKWMLDNGKSKTTVGIYLRSLRTLFNTQSLDKSLYPFGDSKGKYSIPVGRNIKKALTVEEVARIYNYKPTPNTTKEMARDYWIFLYLCNGMNVKDFCLLKWENIEGETLTYQRAKTKRKKRDEKPIFIDLKPEALEIIKKWGQPNLDRKAFIFPHLNNIDDPDRQRAIYQQLTKTINKYMRQIGSEVGINKNVTTYYARHSFATVLKRSGASIEMISELLGHSSVNVTDSYLDGFEREQVRQATQAITSNFTKGA